MANMDYAVKRNLAKQCLFTGQKPILDHLDIELTERCNNACMHCYINRSANDKYALHNELTTEEWKNIISQAAELGAISVRFTGGEPLLRTDFSDLYLYTRRLGLQVMLFTNGRLITAELAYLFSKVPPLKKIELSVYGMRSQSYDAISCVPGAFKEFRRGVALLEDYHIPFIVKSVILPHNRIEIDELKTWASTLTWMNHDPSIALFLDLRTRRDSQAKNELITRLRVTPEEGVAYLSHQEELYHSEMAEFCSKFIGPPGDHLFSCGAGETGCVDAYGNHQMCMLLRHPDTVYDLRKGTIREALTVAFPKYKELRATNPDYLVRCARCFLRGLCVQCPAKSWSEHGTLDTPVEYFCQVAHAQARFLGLLAENEYGWEIVNWQDRVAALAQRYHPKDKINPDSVLHVCEESSE